MTGSNVSGPRRGRSARPSLGTPRRPPQPSSRSRRRPRPKRPPSRRTRPSFRHFGRFRGRRMNNRHTPRSFYAGPDGKSRGTARRPAGSAPRRAPSMAMAGNQAPPTAARGRGARMERPFADHSYRPSKTYDLQDNDARRHGDGVPVRGPIVLRRRVLHRHERSGRRRRVQHGARRASPIPNR